MVQVIRGQVPSKSNCYEIININGHSSLKKSKKVKEYERIFNLQCDKYRNANIQGKFAFEGKIYFRSMMSDLDNGLKVVLDCLQACGAIKNDRYCMDIHAVKDVDPKNPRIEFTITEL